MLDHSSSIALACRSQKPGADWDLDYESSTRPHDTLRTAFDALSLVVGRAQTEFPQTLFENVLDLHLTLRFLGALRKQWKPTNRQRGVLYTLWHRDFQSSKILEVRFYKHGGFAAVLALGLMLEADKSIINELNALSEERVVNIATSIKYYQHPHPSIDIEVRKLLQDPRKMSSILLFLY